MIFRFVVRLLCWFSVKSTTRLTVAARVGLTNGKRVIWPKLKAHVAVGVSADQGGCKRSHGLVTPESTCRDLYDAIPVILFRRNWPGDREMLNGILDEHPEWKEWLKSRQSDVQVRHRLIAGDDVALPFDAVVKLIENADYRLVRNDDDLLAVIEDRLLAIGA